MTVQMHITAQWFRERHAYEPEVADFIREWPDGVGVSEASLLRAAALGLSLTWFARHWLPAPLWAEYKRQLDPLWAKLERQLTLLLAEYKRQLDPLLAEYKRQEVVLLATFLPQMATLAEEEP